MSFQRYQYCPGFPQFLKVDGATTYNTWHENPRLEVTDASFQKWLSSKEEAKEWASCELGAGGSEQDAYELFQVTSEPQIMRVMLRMLFGNENSPVATDTWEEDGEILTRWLACCVHRPLERIRWAPVLRGAHGIGKGTFQHFAQALMGRGSVKRGQQPEWDHGSVQWSYGANPSAGRGRVLFQVGHGDGDLQTNCVGGLR